MRKSGGIPLVISTRFSLSMEMSRLTRETGLPKPSSETKFSGANGNREIFIFPVQLSRIGSLTRLILTVAIYVMAIHVEVYRGLKVKDHIYIHTHIHTY